MTDFPSNIKANPANDHLDRYPSIDDMLRVINKMKPREMFEAAERDKIPLPARQSLIVFLRDWRIEDPGHERFMKFIPEGFPKQDALMMGDLLSFCMVEGEERKKSQVNLENEFMSWKRWQDYLQPFYKKLPKELSITDLTGLHVKLLNMLPQNNYHQYTITQLFSEDETFLSSLVGEKIQITPLQFEALTMLTRIVETGAISQFKLALASGSDTSLAEMSQKKNINIGSMVLAAFKLAQSAVQHFQLGDFNRALIKLDELYSNYGIGAQSFATGIDQIFVATLNSVQSSSKGNVTTKGSSKPVLMSLDTSFKPMGFPEQVGGFPGSAINASQRVRQAASAEAIISRNDAKLGVYSREDESIDANFGTNGLRVFSHVEGNSGDMTKATTMTTDWYALFAACVCQEDGILSEAVDDAWWKSNDLVTKVFTNEDSRPILRFLIHGFLEDGIKDLLPKGLLTVGLSPMADLNTNAQIHGKSKGAIPKVMTDMIFQDFYQLQRDVDSDKVKIPTIGLDNETLEGDADVEAAFADLGIGVEGRRKAAKRPSKKRISQGQMIAIDLTPSTHVRLSKAALQADYIKALNKEDPDFKHLWNKYGKGNKPIRGKGKDRGKYKWRGKLYNSEEAVKKAISKEGSYADYKGGQSNMRMIYAPRKDNGNFVPFRLLLPQIMVRQSGDTIVAKKGSADTKKTQKLLNRLEADFGKLKFKVRQLAIGGYDRYPEQRKKGDTKTKPVTAIDRGVNKVFQAEGLGTNSERFSTNAHPSAIKPSGAIIYSAMTKSGQPVEMEVR